MRKLIFGCGTLASLVLACGPRDPRLDIPFALGTIVPLEGSVAIVDAGLERLLMLTSPKEGELTVTALELGANFMAIAASGDKKELYALAAGDEDGTEPATLQVFSGNTQPKLLKTYELGDGMQQLAIDPLGQWVAAYQSLGSVQNPNELLLIDRSNDDGEPIAFSAPSQGGIPNRIIFSPELHVPGGARRFLAVTTERYVVLADLSHLDRPGITLPLSESADGTPYPPVQIVFDDGDPEVDTDARIAVRMANTADVILYQLVEPTKEGQDFHVLPNIIDAGGVPSTLDFVRTDGGLRVAALVPSLAQATLIDPDTNAPEIVDLDLPLSQLSRITDSVEELPAGGDVALLWGGTDAVAFWALGSTSGTPYRSIDRVDLATSVARVLDVPAPHQSLKVLEGQGGGQFYILDLEERQTAPIVTDSAGYSATVSPSGKRLWLSRLGNDEFSVMDLDTLHPRSLRVDDRVHSVVDIERKDGGRAAVVIHDRTGQLSATVFDGDDPDSKNAQIHVGLHLEGL